MPESAPIRVGFFPEGPARIEGACLAFRHLRRLAGVWPSWLVLIVAAIVAVVIYFAIALVIVKVASSILEWYISILPLAIACMTLVIYLYYRSNRLGLILRRLRNSGHLRKVALEIHEDAVLYFVNGMSVRIPFESIDGLFVGRRGLHLLAQDGVIAIPNAAFDEQGVSRAGTIERLRAALNRNAGQQDSSQRRDR